MNNYEQVTPTSNGTSVSRSDISYVLCMIVIFVAGFLLVWLLVQLYFAR
jgi:hypothetical protein